MRSDGADVSSLSSADPTFELQFMSAGAIGDLRFAALDGADESGGQVYEWSMIRRSASTIAASVQAS